MELDFNSDRPIFQQIAEGLEDGILSGAYGEGEQVPSITEFSVAYKINPATALKGINLLVDQGILFKKRGIGMFVAKGAKEQIIEKRKQNFYDRYVRGLVEEAESLSITEEELLEMIRRARAKEGQN